MCVCVCVCVQVCHLCVHEINPSSPSLPLADLVAAMGAQSVIAVDVGAEDNNDISNYGDHISGWWLLWNKFNPFASQKLRVSKSHPIL